MHNNIIKIFKSQQFGEIRTLMSEQGEPWFAGKDVCDALGYLNQPKALRDHVDEDDKLTERIVLAGQRRQVIFINESGLYSLVLSSKLPSAKQFKRWVTSEVLPQIRRTGGYIPTHDSEGRRLTEQEVMQRANRIAARTVKQKNLPADDCLSAKEVAKRLGMEVKDMNRLLQNRGIIRWTGGRYRLTPEYEGRGLASDRFFLYRSLEGEQKERSYLVWTLAGVQFIENINL